MKKPQLLIIALIAIVVLLSVALVLALRPPPTAIVDGRIVPKPQPLNHVEATLNSSVPYTSPNSMMPSGKKGIVCNVTVSYKGTQGKIHVMPFQIQLTASNHQIYSHSGWMPFVGNYQKPLQGTLLPGGSTTGEVLFVVDVDAEPVEVKFVDAMAAYGAPSGEAAMPQNAN
jgi:hypothetical protein